MSRQGEQAALLSENGCTIVRNRCHTHSHSFVQDQGTDKVFALGVHHAHRLVYDHHRQKLAIPIVFLHHTVLESHHTSNLVSEKVPNPDVYSEGMNVAVLGFHLGMLAHNCMRINLHR